MTVSTQNIRATVAGIAVPIIESNVTLDETRAPYAVADFTVPFTEELADLLDPRTGARVSIIMQQSFRGSETLGDISATLSPTDTLGDLSAAWAGMDLADLTTLWSHLWNPGGALDDAHYLQSRTFDLSIRARDIDHLASTVRVRATSDESILTGYALLRDNPAMPDSYAVEDAVRLVLRTVLPGASLIVDAPTAPVEPEAAIWAPGRGAWEYLSPLTASQGLRLWCDEHRTWRLGNPAVADWPGAQSFRLVVEQPDYPWPDENNATTVEDTVSLDDGLWFDGVVVTYRWTPWTVDGTGTPQVAYDVAGPSDARNVMSVDLRDTPYPGPGEAAARLAKVSQLGRVISGTTRSDFRVGPRSLVAYHSSSTNNLTGWLAAVSWSLPDGTMRIRMRDMVP
jgi:hypothetical protein